MSEKLESLLQTLEDVANRQDQATPAMNDLARMFELAGNVVAWQVAVVSPGFLGLLWNARMLATSSRLPSLAFHIVFVVAEVSFLIGIIAAVVLHGYLMEKPLHAIGRSTALQAIKLNVVAARTRNDDAKVVSEFKELLDSHDESLAKFKALPWYVLVLGKCHGWVTVAGYVLVGVIIVTLKLS